MNSNNSPLLSEAFEGLAPLSASGLVLSSPDSSFATAAGETNASLADPASFFLKKRPGRSSLSGMLMFCAFCGILASVHAEDITTDQIKSGAGSIAGVEYDAAATIGTISSTVSGTATGNTGVGLYAEGGMTIGKIASTAVISGVAGYNTAYGLHANSGNIVIEQAIDGTITAAAATDAGRPSGKPAIGIYASKGDITLEGISLTGKVSVSTNTGGQAKAIQANNNLTIIGSLAGTIESNSLGTLGYGLWASKGVLTLGSMADTGSITVNANFNARAMQAAEGISVGAMDGDITAHSVKNEAHGIMGSSNNNTIRSNVSIASLGELSSITAKTEEGWRASGITSAYGYVIIGSVDGRIAVSSGSTSTSDSYSSDRFSSFGICSQWGTTLGDLGAGADIEAISAGADAFGLFAGRDGGTNAAVNKAAEIVIGNVAGSIRAAAPFGYVGAVYTENKVTLGDVASGAVIAASSHGSADTYGVYAGYLLKTGVINGTVSASTTGNYSFALMGLGIEAAIGETGVLFASGAEGSKTVYAVYSGNYQQDMTSSGSVKSAADRGLETANVADTLSFHAGAQVDGIIELGGSGKTGRDTLNLFGGTAEKAGLFDYKVQTTINTKVTNPPSDTQYSFVQLHVGTDDSPAFWEVGGQSGLFNMVRINPGSVVTVNDASLSPRAGGSVLNMGTIEGVGSLTIGSGMSFITGVLGMNSAGTGLETRTTGLGSGFSVSIEKGASLGTSVVNTTQDAWVVTEGQIDAARNALFAGVIGAGYSAEDYTFTYFLKGQVYLGNGTPIQVRPGTAFIVGEGAEVTLGENLPTNGFRLEGGTVDVSASVSRLLSSANKISGSVGTLLMGENQELVLDQSQTIGYDIRAKGASTGRLTVTGQDCVIHASGNYDARTVNIVNGAVFSQEGGSLGSSEEGATIQVGAEYVSEKNPATLVIRDAVVKSALNIGANSLLQGTGTFEKRVTLYSNKVHVGNSPGVMNFKGGLDARGVSDFTFYVEGTAPENYSSMNIGNSLSWSFSHVNVELGDKLLSSESEHFSLVLIDASQAEATGLEDGQSLEVTKNAAFLSEYSLVWDEVAQKLVFSGTLDRGLINDARTAAGAPLLNALWSSTRSVTRFGQVARAQLDGPRAGKSNFWVSGLGDFSSAGSSASVEGFDYQGGGYAVGADYVLEKNWTGGIAFGQSFGTNESARSMMKIRQDSLMGALYARYFNELNSRVSLALDSCVSFGNVRNKADGATLGGDASRARWDDSVSAFGTRLQWNCKVGEKSLLTPFVGMDFVNGRQEAFHQAYGEGTNRYFDGKLQTWTLPVGVTWKTDIALGGSHFLTPEITAAYAGDISRRDPVLRTTSLGEALDIEGVSPGRHAFIGNAGVRWTINAQWNAGAYYDLECRSGMTNQGVNANVRYTF